ncbi:MAG: RHS repeat-associated core domain-containing protein [Pseudomonadales bacterium]|nr:RHS repeat-associated core domain-containing protein [Pseudomonadales bacterium]
MLWIEHYQVVTRMEQPDGIGGNASIEYSYQGLKRDLDGHGSLGFARITARNLQLGMTTITDYAQAFPYSSQPIRVEVRRSDTSQVLSITQTEYGLHGTEGNGAVFPYVSSRVTDTYDPNDERVLAKSTTTNQVDAYGNITESVEETIDNENGITFKKRTINTYTIDEVNWRIGQLTSTVVRPSLNGMLDPPLNRRTDFTYYPSTGFLEDTVQQPGQGAGIRLTKTLDYDAFGNVTTQTVSGPGLPTRVTTITYDLRGQFPLTLTNPLGHQMSRTWNSDFGTKKSETDANGQTTAWYYNVFGQQVMAVSPDGVWSSTVLWEETAGSHPTAVRYLDARAQGKPSVREFYDLLGRTVRTRTRGFDGSYINQDTEYDSKGRVYRVSEPYFDGDAIEWNTHTYDFMGRVTAIDAADPVKSVTSTYDGFSVAVTDAQNRTKYQTQNAVGQIITVIDEMGTRMNFTYDAAGNRTQVTNAVAAAEENSVSYTYDRLGRMLTQDDPDHGVYTYTYDALGQKLTEISPKMADANQSVSYQYDLLGRMINRTEPEGVTTWTYDNTSNGNLGIGQLHSEDSPGFSRTYSYAPGNHGRLTGTATIIDSITFNTGMTYNSLGQLATETYPGSVTSPGGFQVAYTYNALGYQERVQAPGGGTVYYQMLASDAAGHTTSEWLGDGSISSQVYEGASSRLIEQHTVNGGTDIQHFAYDYDDAGNMESRSDLRLGLSEAFSFDDLDRLTSGSVIGGTPATYGFDVVGNITEKSDVGNPYLYTSSAVHAVTEITAGGTTQTLNYDDNGNLNSGDDVPGIYWSTYNKPLWLAKGSVYYVFNYGPDRQRYRKFHGDDTTYYIGNGFERTNSPTGMSFRHIVRANGRAIMLRKDSTGGTASHQYIHRDHLGSVTALTRETDGSVIERYSYDAWGQRRSADTWLPATITAYEQRGYTGHEHLDDIGIIHMNGRIYDPRLGRMLSPDPVTQAPENGQNYNRYTYAYNNPLKYSDPSGFTAHIKNVLWDGNSGGVLRSQSGQSESQTNYNVAGGVRVTVPPPFVGNSATYTFANNSGHSGSNIPIIGDWISSSGNPRAETSPVSEKVLTTVEPAGVQKRRRNSKLYDNAVAAAKEVVKIVDGAVLDEIVPLPIPLSHAPVFGLMVDVITHTPPDQMLSNYVGAWSAFGFGAVIGTPVGAALGIGLGASVSFGSQYFYQNFMAPTCSGGSRCSVEDFEKRQKNHLQD